MVVRAEVDLQVAVVPVESHLAVAGAEVGVVVVGEVVQVVETSHARETHGSQSEISTRVSAVKGI